MRLIHWLRLVAARLGSLPTTSSITSAVTLSSEYKGDSPFALPAWSSAATITRSWTDNVFGPWFGRGCGPTPGRPHPPRQRYERVQRTPRLRPGLRQRQPRRRHSHQADGHHATRGAGRARCIGIDPDKGFRNEVSLPIMRHQLQLRRQAACPQAYGRRTAMPYGALQMFKLGGEDTTSFTTMSTIRGSRNIGVEDATLCGLHPELLQFHVWAR
jgi:hypothetical protein